MQHEQSLRDGTREQNREVEVKFGILGNPEEMMEILGSIGQISEPQVRRLGNVYYDTPDQKLFACGAGLRVRSDGTHCEQTLKLRGQNYGGVHSRGEFNLPLPEGELIPDLMAFPDKALPDDLDRFEVGAALRPLCEINFERRSCDFATLDCLFEVAYDRGEIVLDGEPVLPINELEIELKRTARPDDEVLLIFNSLITTCAEHGLPLVLEPFSKMHRATLMRDNTRNRIEFATRSQAASLGGYILNLIMSFENLYGLFMLREDPLIFGCLLASLKVLIKALKRLGRSGLAAFRTGERDPVSYRDDLEIMVAVLSRFAARLKKFRPLITKCALRGDAQTVAVLTERIREAECELKICVIPLKLRLLLGMLVEDLPPDGL